MIKKALLTLVFVGIGYLTMAQGFYDLLKTDVSIKRRSLVKKHLQLSADEEKKFQPLFEEYLEDITAFYDDQRKKYKTALEYFQDLDEQKASDLADQFFAYNEDRLALKKKYFEKMDEQLSTVTVVKFFQIDHQIDVLIDVQIAGEMPLIDEGF